jgi:hypothetical protein
MTLWPPLNINVFTMTLRPPSNLNVSKMTSWPPLNFNHVLSVIMAALIDVTSHKLQKLLIFYTKYDRFYTKIPPVTW